MIVVMKVAYVGTSYHGFQKQLEEENTIQGILENVLGNICGYSVPVIGASRTDSGVHAKGQMVQFEVEDSIGIPADRYKLVFNKRLPLDIRILKSWEVEEDFHVRYDVVKKQYIYRIDRHKDPVLMEIPFSYHYPYPLNIDEMEKGASFLIGTHDFRSFSGAGSSVKNFVRTIYEIGFEEKEGVMEIVFIGSGFLYKMIRRIVGTLIDIGRGHLSSEVFKAALEDLDEGYSFLGSTVPGKGLCLKWIKYKEGAETW